MPPDFEPLKFFATLGVGGILAGIIFFYSRKDGNAYAAAWQGQAAILLSVVKENTAALTANTKTIEALLTQITKQKGRE